MIGHDSLQSEKKSSTRLVQHTPSHILYNTFNITCTYFFNLQCDYHYDHHSVSLLGNLCKTRENRLVSHNDLHQSSHHSAAFHC